MKHSLLVMLIGFVISLVTFSFQISMRCDFTLLQIIAASITKYRTLEFILQTHKIVPNRHCRHYQMHSIRQATRSTHIKHITNATRVTLQQVSRSEN